MKKSVLVSGGTKGIGRAIVERFAKEGVESRLSTLADQVGACAEALALIHALIRTHVLAAKRLHAHDTTVTLLAKGGATTARLWTYLRDDRP